MDVLSMARQFEKIKPKKVTLCPSFCQNSFRERGKWVQFYADDIALEAYLQIIKGNERIMKTSCIKYEKNP